MTTVVWTRQPLQVLSMSNQPEPRKSKRLAALYDEQDGDFTFARASKRAKTGGQVEEEKPAPAKKSARGRPARDRTNNATAAPKTAAAPAVPQSSSHRRSSRRKASVDAAEEMPALVLPKRTTRRSTRRTSAETQPDTNGGSTHDGDRMELVGGTPEPPPRDEAEKVALPLSDTPVINRNKEMRKKGGGNRRSSLGMRGRRASSLIDMGYTALPHKEVESSEFYKHIEAVGLPEPRRMKQLLTWCGERALSEKPPIGSSNSHAILGARAIQDQLLKDFQSESEFSDWFSREDGPPVEEETKKQPNPRNVELEEKAQQLEERIQRLREQKKAWLALKKTIPPEEPLYPTPDSAAIPPDEAHLDPPEVEMLRSLSGPTSFAALKAQTEARLKAIQSDLEFRIDSLADGVHKLDQRVATAGREADKVLALGASRLKEREEREKQAAGTKDIPVMEVIRSLGKVLPEGG